MAKPTRLANKTQWALQDILAELAEARRALRGIQSRNEERIMDPIISMHLQRLTSALARVEVTTVRAQHGEYHGSLDPAPAADA